MFLKVANYGIAGQYDVHYDPVMMGKDSGSEVQKRTLFNRHAGDRMATASLTISAFHHGSVSFKQNRRNTVSW